MKKKQKTPEIYFQASNRKLLHVMKLCFLFLWIALFQLSASELEQGTKVTLKLQNAPVGKVIDEIEKLSDYTINFSSKYVDVSRLINVDFKNAEIEEVLELVFKGTNIGYQIKNNQILLFDKIMQQPQKIQSVKGVVKDIKGEPIPGVSITVKGTTLGTITAVDGTYRLDLPADAKILMFSFIGMKATEVMLANQPMIDVILEEDTESLQEVVVVGYGSTSKTKLVSALTQVETKGLTEVPYTSSVSSLAGRASGLIVAETGGNYGNLPRISIRGGGEPTYVIDGIKANKEIFALIPPGDIEDITVLKDASAAAVFGFGSSNGVILITTKRSGKGKMQISYNMDYALQTNPLRPEFMSKYEKATFDNALAFNDGRPAIVDDKTLNDLKNNLDPERNPLNNPYDEMIKKAPSQQRHSLTISGSQNGTDVYLSANYFNQESVYKLGDNGLDRYSLRLNVGHKFEQIGLSTSAGMNFSRQAIQYPPSGEWLLWVSALGVRRGTPLYNPAGNYYGEGNGLAMMDPAAGYSKYETNRGIGDLTLKWEVPFIKGLTLKGVGLYRMEQGFNKLWSSGFRNSAPLYSWDNKPADMGKPTLFQETNRFNTYTLEGHVNYLRTLGRNHTIELTGVVVKSESRNDYFSAYRKDFISSAVDQLFAGDPNGQQTNGNASEGGSLGYVGRLKYDYKSKYILEASARYDGNDNFPSESRWELFPAVTVGWNMTEEEFLKPYFEKIALNSFKLRASMGNTGSIGEVNRFGYISNYTLNNSSYYIDGKWQGAFVEGPLVSRELSWQITQSRNLGLDFALQKNKLSGSIDWFFYRTTGYIGNPQTGYITPLGKPLPQVNLTSAFRRGGIEGSLSYHTNIGGVQLNVGGNISYFDQLWEKNDKENEIALKNPYTRTTHQTDYYTVGYQDLGYYQSINQIINSPRRLASTKTYMGDLSYEDTNGDGKIDGDDQRRIGKSSFPHITYGVTLNASYKGFTLDALIQGTSNRQMYLNASKWMDGTNAITYTILDDYWKEGNTDALFPRQSTELYWVNGQNNIVNSSFWLKDAWYVRLKSLSLSYDLKHRLLHEVNFINGCSIVLSATNLLTISPVTKYLIDPEIADYSTVSYPVMRTYNLGFRVTF
ncbi:MAG: SusC/RagA family TonB-linked outer membrane protein [Breznakibacter sp.]